MKNVKKRLKNKFKMMEDYVIARFCGIAMRIMIFDQQVAAVIAAAAALSGAFSGRSRRWEHGDLGYTQMM